MNKVYDVGIHNGNLIGSDYTGQSLYKLGTPVYFNTFTGLLYTKSHVYVIMSYAEDEWNSEEKTKEQIQAVLNDIWAYA